MSMFATIRVDNEIELPHFPEEIDRDDMAWQSKQGLDVYSGPYRITAEGRLEQKKVSHREKTDEEKAEEAEKWGFDSWDEMKQVYDEAEDSMLYPDEIDYDSDEDGYEETPPLFLSERTTDETWWADISHHGTFEFHQLIKRDPIKYEELEPTHGVYAKTRSRDGVYAVTNTQSAESTYAAAETIERPSEHALEVFLEYEARFQQGDLTDLVFMGERHTSVDDPIGEALDKIEEWREWKEEQE